MLLIWKPPIPKDCSIKSNNKISHFPFPPPRYVGVGCSCLDQLQQSTINSKPKKNKPIAQMFARSPTARGVVAGDLRHGGTHSTFLVTPTHLKFKMAHCRSAHEKSFHRLVCLCKKNTNFLGNSGSTLNTGSMLKVNLYTLCQLCFVTY